MRSRSLMSKNASNPIKGGGVIKCEMPNEKLSDGGQEPSDLEPKRDPAVRSSAGLGGKP